MESELRQFDGCAAFGFQSINLFVHLSALAAQNCLN
jgi:hypothetical protein